MAAELEVRRERIRTRGYRKMKRLAGILTDLMAVVLGNVLYAAGVVFFVVPGNLITGGTTGISLFVNRMTGMPVSLFLLIVNGLLFLLGFVILGRKFAATTAVSTFVYPAAVELLTRWKGDYLLTEEPILCVLFGGVCIGAAIGIVMRAGSSTGGMDIPPLILNKLFRLPISATIYVLDVLILLLQAVGSTGEGILYGLALVLTYSLVLDKCLLIGKTKIQVKVVSERSDEIRRAILEDVDRGVTLMKSTTGYTMRDLDMVLTVVSNRELAKVERLVHSIDENAFVIVNQVSEVSGRGFTKAKMYGDKV